ncbi:J domain-containing protein OS=Streptomyces microflavus OX=1919 GN=Smic_38900 PE=4 SV=1 [Streptomyces microflavus]
MLAGELEESAIGSMLRMAPDDPDQLLADIGDQLLGEVAKREAELAAMVQ